MYYGFRQEVVPSFSNDLSTTDYDNKISSLNIRINKDSPFLIPSVTFDYTIQTTATVDLGGITPFCGHRRGNCGCSGCNVFMVGFVCCACGECNNCAVVNEDTGDCGSPNIDNNWNSDVHHYVYGGHFDTTILVPPVTG
jgi:hypothetical protein